MVKLQRSAHYINLSITDSMAYFMAHTVNSKESTDPKLRQASIALVITTELC